MDFGHSHKWILTYQICNVVVLDHLFQFEVVVTFDNAPTSESI